MGNLEPVFSGASMQHMPVPAPGRILVSVAECGKSPAALKKVRKIIKRSGAENIYLDNGMFSYFQKWKKGKTVILDRNRWVYPKGVAMNLTSEHLAYYNSVLKPYATFCLDLPTPRLKAKHDPGEEEFHFNLSAYHNIIRAREMSEMKKKFYPLVNQFFVFQGYNVNQLIRIKTELGNLQFDGFALATRTLKWNQMTAMMLMLHHFGVRKIHVLAGSNMPTMAICAFMARHLFDEVSYDSANWLKYGIFGDIRLFGSMRGIATGKIIKIPESILNAQCGCQHCNGRSVKDFRNMANDNVKMQLLIKHNALIEVETAKVLYAHSETPDMLRDFLLTHSRRTKLILEIHQCLSGIDSLKNNLGDYAFAKGFAEYNFKMFKAR